MDRSPEDLSRTIASIQRDLEELKNAQTKAMEVTTGMIEDGAITTAKLNNEAVTTAKIASTTIESLGSYSTSEKATAFTWIDGKTIYKKTIDFGYLPNNATKNVAHGISNLDKFIKYEGIAAFSTKYTITLPVSNPVAMQYNVELHMDATNVTVVSGADQSGAYGYITLYYTKTA